MRIIVVTGLGLALLVGLALLLATRTDQDDREPLSPSTREAVSVDTLLDVSQAYYRQPLRVDGRVAAVGDGGRFALEGPTGTILVDPEPGARDVREGARVEVFGTLDRLGRVPAGAIGEVGEARTDVGSPFVSAEIIRTS